ncbi:hypothetical protein OG594_08850 [Streptomyces sp. NBC_01214]|uniref:hypothetical protein n=1 Tax=Streptomyces sp. NBC_01214 TaxID=2903777 RepID=UPI0022577BD3|nr:hypothetical protein [Streptomyces sp. NBC_01214]MCX4801758.1 hypothetical protein [Streptomyces sp. NBC_01214]
MLTSTPENLTRREEQARTLAARIVVLLDNLDDLGIGVTVGQLHTPAGVIRRQPERGWTVTDR